jgi:hypothetical protein
MAAVTPGENRIRLLYRMRAQQLFWRMLGRQGIDPAAPLRQGLEQTIDHAITRCRGCRAVTECKSWLDEDTAPSSSATFCPNGSTMEAFRMSAPDGDNRFADVDNANCGLRDLLDDPMIKRLMTADHVNAEILRHALTDTPRFTAAYAAPQQLPSRKSSVK